MSMVSSLDLRVLEGLHQGAHVPLAPFAQGLQIAAAGQADVLLRDAPGQARLAATGDGLQWQEDGFSQALQPGMVWRWGQVVLGLAQSQDSWPAQLPPLAFERSPIPAPEASAAVEQPGNEAAAADAEAEPSDAPSPVAPAQALPPTVQRSVPARWTAARTVWVLAVVIAVALALLGLAARTAAPPAASTPLTAAATTLPRIDMRQVRQLLVDLSLEMVVLPKLRPDGRLVLKGVVSDDQALEALAAGLRKITGNASVMVITQREFIARVKALQDNLPEGIVARPQDDGALVLEAADDKVDWTLARQLVEGELPEVALVDQVVLDAASQPENDGLAPAFEGSRMRDAAFPAIPRIAVVMGGARPYLMLEQGQKWLPGGKIGGLTLQAVEDQSLVFEDAQGRTWRRPR